MHFTFIDVVARAIVNTQMVASLACTPIWAPVIDAPLWTKARSFRTFVDVNASFLIVPVSLETFFAFASIRASRVHTIRITGTNLRFPKKIIIFSRSPGQWQADSPVLDRIHIRWHLRSGAVHLVCARSGTSKCSRPVCCGKFHRGRN